MHLEIVVPSMIVLYQYIILSFPYIFGVLLVILDALILMITLNMNEYILMVNEVMKSNKST